MIWYHDMHVMIVIITKRNMLHKRTNRKKRELGINSHGPAAHALEQLDSKHFSTRMALARCTGDLLQTDSEG